MNKKTRDFAFLLLWDNFELDAVVIGFIACANTRVFAHVYRPNRRQFTHQMSNRRNRDSGLPGWREINKTRDALQDDLGEKALPVAAEEYKKQMNKIVTLVSSPTTPSERVGLALNRLTEIVIDMVSMMDSSSCSNADRDNGAAAANENLARLSEEYNTRLAQLQDENERLRAGLAEMREKYDVASADQERVLQAMALMRQEKDRLQEELALARRDRDRLVNNGMRYEELASENRRLKKKVNKQNEKLAAQRKRLAATDEAVRALEEAEEEEMRLRRKKEKKARKEGRK